MTLRSNRPLFSPSVPCLSWCTCHTELDDGRALQVVSFVYGMIMHVSIVLCRDRIPSLDRDLLHWPYQNRRN